MTRQVLGRSSRHKKYLEEMQDLFEDNTDTQFFTALAGDMKILNNHKGEMTAR